MTSAAVSTRTEAWERQLARQDLNEKLDNTVLGIIAAASEDPRMLAPKGLVSTQIHVAAASWMQQHFSEMTYTQRRDAVRRALQRLRRRRLVSWNHYYHMWIAV